MARVKIYTKTGDKGQTRLSDGSCVTKDTPRVDAYGSVDELNASIGVVRAQKEVSHEIDDLLDTVQRDLFALGADVALPSQKSAQKPSARIGEYQVRNLEDAIDKIDSTLPELHSFILPGGGGAGALLHSARTVCRRAERAVVTASRTETINPEVVRYLNRLSDLLFVLARRANANENSHDIVWKQ